MIDTHAQCNTLSLNTFQNMSKPNPNIKLNKTYSTIKAFGNQTVKPIGKTSFDVEVKDRVYTLTCGVVQGKNIPNLLGAEDSQRLELTKRVDQVNLVIRNLKFLKTSLLLMMHFQACSNL